MRRGDDAIFSRAVADNRVVITSNCGDFIDPAQAHPGAGGHHPGVLLVFLYNNDDNDMSVPEIIRATANVEVTGI